MQLAALIEGSVHAALLADGCSCTGPEALTLDSDQAAAIGHLVVFHHAEALAEGGPPRFEVYRMSANRWTLRRTKQGWRVAHRVNALLDGVEAARALLRPGAPVQPAN